MTLYDVWIEIFSEGEFVNGKRIGIWLDTAWRICWANSEEEAIAKIKASLNLDNCVDKIGSAEPVSFKPDRKEFEFFKFADSLFMSLKGDNCNA